jgi:hypothetical protein
VAFSSTIINETNPTVQPVAPISPLVERKDGDGITRVRDANGRQIGVKPLTAIDMFRLTRALGDDASNAALFRQAMVAYSCVEIDGVPLARPLNLMTIEALIIRLDFAGFVAVSGALAGAAAEPINTEAVKTSP